ncbi:hypothetical protein HOH87_01350 [bacterium]|jgi:hypothetical protein|nr:hypothetical protein [bacterium]
MRFPDTICGLTDLKEILQRVEDPSYWTTQFSEMKIEALEPQWLPETPFSNSEKDRMTIDGYFVQKGLLAGQPIIPRLKNTVTTLFGEGMLPLWASVFDEYWELARLAQPSIKAILGADYKLLPDTWAWFLAPHNLTQGWAPHRDRLERTLRSDGRPMSITLWVSLTDATPENGCMYFLPASLDPNYPDNLTLKIDNWQDIRAVPVPEGSLMGWNQTILHWGGRSSQWASNPRISIAFEAQCTDVPAFNEPLLEPNERPSFEMRLALIGKQLLQYQHMYQLSDIYRQLGTALAQHAETCTIPA